MLDLFKPQSLRQALITCCLCQACRLISFQDFSCVCLPSRLGYRCVLHSSNRYKDFKNSNSGPRVCSACTQPAELPSPSCSIKHSSGLLTQCPHGRLLIYFTMTEMTSRIAPLFQICALLRIAAFTIWRSYKDIMKKILIEILE